MVDFLIMDTLYLTCLLFLLQYTTILVRGAPCAGQKLDKVFGPGCKYLCHCGDPKEQCDDVTGSCHSGCADRWMGPGCQYRDIAWKKPTALSTDTHFADSVNDGKKDTCSRSNDNTEIRQPWWSVRFNLQNVIQGLAIVTHRNNLSFFRGFAVYVEDSSNTNSQTNYTSRERCYQHDGTSTINISMTVICERALKGNQVRIQLAEKQRQLVLCDVRIFGGRNLAYSQSTQQSSTHASYTSSAAVDGSERTCVDTLTGSEQWWRVDFDITVHVQAIELITRDVLRMNDKLHVGTNYSSITSGDVQLYKKRWFLTTDTICQFVKFERQGHRISLCEFDVFGDCLENKCGLDCSIPCHCAVFTFDNKISGTCPEGCLTGWTGVDGRCDTVSTTPSTTATASTCASGRWGPTCGRHCHCNNSEPCNDSTGICPHGCKDGYKATPKCEEECVDGTYGPGCSGQCSGHCLDNDVCDKEDGHCLRGCAAGWTGKQCDKACPIGKYGTGCSRNCSPHCWTMKRCNAADRRCSHCRPGWTGDRCDEECDDGTFGSRCTKACSIHCVGNVCDKVTGHCSAGCSPGWRGDNCTAECLDGSYGDNCSGRCSGHCLNNGVCDKVTGSCPVGCSAGWTEDRCDKGCQTGKYGLKCSKTCSTHCTNSGQCDKENGHCKPCRPGWTGDRCDTAAYPLACRDGSFGNNCSEMCSGHCLNNGVCDKVTGSCPRGCSAGWTGDTCDNGCQTGKYGLKCSRTCSTNCRNSGQCNKENGHCKPCRPGWTGDRCDTGLDGVKGKTDVQGKAMSEGRDGVKSLTEIQGKGMSEGRGLHVTSVLVAVAVTAAVVLMIGAIVGVAVFMRRRNRTQPTQEHETRTGETNATRETLTSQHSDHEYEGLDPSTREQVNHEYAEIDQVRHAGAGQSRRYRRDTDDTRV